MKWTPNIDIQILKDTARLDMLGLFSVEFISCHVTAGWVAPSVHIADGVKKSYSSLDVTMFISPDACTVVLDAHTWWHYMSH